MIGITSASKNRIHELVDDLFDKMSLQLVGEIPSLKNKKSIIFTSKPDMTLAHLFLQSIGPQKPNQNEIEALKNLLSTAEEYVSALRAKTKAQLTEKIDNYVKEKYMKKERPSTVDIKAHINDVFDSAKNHFKTIAEAESTKARNIGQVFTISRVAASQGVSDPNVFFVVVRDQVTCKDCIRLHLMPDGTPKVWKLSEIGFGYGKRTDDKPTLVRHPHCRCSLSFLAPDFGFKNGFVSYVGIGHDEYKKQKAES